jgi:hypothetical protein
MRTSVTLILGGLLMGVLAMPRSAPGAAANVSIGFPPDVTASNSTVGPSLGVSFNKAGNRCQQDCGTGNGNPANVGLSVNASFAFVAHGSTPPQLEVFSDGRIVGRSTTAGASLVASDGNYDIYTISMQTQCSTRKVCMTGTNIGQNCNNSDNIDCPGSGIFVLCAPKFCSNPNECIDATHQNDACLLCDGAGCSDTTPALCPSTCTGGAFKTDEGKECANSSQCGGGGTCTSTCTMLKNCGRSTSNNCSGVPVKDCTASGAPVFTNETAYTNTKVNHAIEVVGSAPLHVASAQAVGNWWDYGANAIGARLPVGSARNVFRMVNGNSPNFATTCSTNCGGTLLGLVNQSAPNGCQ